MINNNGKVSLKSLIDQFEISKRTAIRDIEYLKNIFNAPIEYSREKKGYIYKNQFDAFNFSDEKLLLFYTFLKSITKNELNFIPFVSKNLLSHISKNLSTNYQQLSNNIVYELSMYENISIKMLHDILQCIINKKQCTITYTNTAGENSKRYIEPFKLINYYGIWYLIAYCCKSRDLRMFVLSRILSIGITTNPYINTIDENELKGFLKHGFGIVKGKKHKEVTIRFYNSAYYIIRNQIWHNQQKKIEGNDPENGKYIELTLPVTSYSEILGRTLQYHINAEVIAPADFRDEWLTIIKNLNNKYLN